MTQYIRDKFLGKAQKNDSLHPGQHGVPSESC